MEELQQVTHLNVSAIGDRTVNLMPLWDGKEWHSWISVNGKIIKMKMMGVVEGRYLAKNVEHKSDLFMPFVDLMWQRTSWPEIVPLISAIEDDFSKMSTSIAKLKHTFQTQKQLSSGSSRAFAETELEYLLVLCRTVFDLLQELIARIWDKRVCLNDPRAESVRKQRKMPDTFSKLCLKEKTVVRSSEELQTLYALPKEMADEYVRAAPFFSQLRNLRNGIVHGGRGLDLIFVTERGFCVGKDSPLLVAIPCEFGYKYNDNLVSILPWLCSLILKTMGTCTSLVGAFASVVPLPDEMAPGYRVFVREPNNDALSEILAINQGGSPWWG